METIKITSLCQSEYRWPLYPVGDMLRFVDNELITTFIIFENALNLVRGSTYNKDFNLTSTSSAVTLIARVSESYTVILSMLILWRFLPNRKIVSILAAIYFYRSCGNTLGLREVQEL